jgi:hypothetical protein
MLDRWLIYLTALDDFTAELGRRGADDIRNVRPGELLDQFVSARSRGTFGDHLAHVRERQLLATELCDLCADANAARNRFLHWMPERFDVPTYQGADVTSEEGIRLFLADVSRIVDTIVGVEQ